NGCEWVRDRSHNPHPTVRAEILSGPLPQGERAQRRAPQAGRMLALILPRGRRRAYPTREQLVFGLSMHRFTIVFCALIVCAAPVAAQTKIQPPISPLPPPGTGGAAPSGPLQILPPTISSDLHIVWEVKNRFRLFRREADFLKHVAA